jgi:uncharacterized membrane protein HdeD (DUF308 family)
VVVTTYWFKPKRYGYGATPTTWQGWTLIVGIIFTMVSVSLYLRLTTKSVWALAALLALDAIALGVLAFISWRKTDGEWRWRWGDR